MTTTNFKQWLDCLAEQDTESMAHLYQSVVEATQMGDFMTTRKGDRLFVKAEGHEDTLMLASESAKKAFLKTLNQEFGGDIGWVIGAAEFRRALEKND